VLCAELGQHRRSRRILRIPQLVSLVKLKIAFYTGNFFALDPLAVQRGFSGYHLQRFLSIPVSAFSA
jgi:hypothetical protein